MQKQEFTLDTFARTLKQTRKAGILGSVMKMLPGMRGMSESAKQAEDQAAIRQLLGLIDSMTPAERQAPTKLIDTSRRRRIATGCGFEPQQVYELVRQFDAMAAMMKELPDLGTGPYDDG